MKKITYLIALLFFALACEKEKNPEPEIEKFPITYRVINNGDTELSSVFLYSWTAFPLENETHIRGSIYNRGDHGEYSLYDYSTIEHTPEYLGYEACKIYAQFSFLHSYPNSEGWMSHIKWKYVFEDTISDISYSEIVFVWPEDTLNTKFTRVE